MWGVGGTGDGGGRGKGAVVGMRGYKEGVRFLLAGFAVVEACS